MTAIPIVMLICLSVVFSAVCYLLQSFAALAKCAEACFYLHYCVTVNGPTLPRVCGSAPLRLALL